VAQDHAEALKWYRRAAEQGKANAQYALSIIYAHGRGVEQDYAEAVAWCRKAAEQGDPGAQFNLGMMYRVGQGVPQDYMQAHMWLNLAASRATNAKHRVEIAKHRDYVAAKMNSAQIAEAQSLVREWKPQ
jgi:TPR repeat protein